jgi:hypothetical protein
MPYLIGFRTDANERFEETEHNNHGYCRDVQHVH